MSILKNVSRSLFFLILSSVPFCVHSDPLLQTFEYENAYSERNITIQNLTEEMMSVDNSRRKLCRNRKKLSYFLYTSDFINSFIEIPTSNVSVDSSTISSRYLAGRAPIYNLQYEKVGTCSASFLCMENQQGIFTDISNYLSVDNGLIISWFTPTTLINLELDTIVHSMITECIVQASTKIGFNPFYGKNFNMIVSSDNTRIYFELYEIKNSD